MNARIWGIIGGIALVLALLSPLVLGSAQKVERIFETAEALYARSDYEGAVEKYKAALKESNVESQCCHSIKLSQRTASRGRITPTTRNSGIVRISLYPHNTAV